MKAPCINCMSRWPWPVSAATHPPIGESPKAPDKKPEKPDTWSPYERDPIRFEINQKGQLRTRPGWQLS